MVGLNKMRVLIVPSNRVDTVWTQEYRGRENVVPGVLVVMCFLKWNRIEFANDSLERMVPAVGC